MYYINSTIVISFTETDIAKHNQFLVTLNDEVSDHISQDALIGYVTTRINEIFDTGNYKDGSEHKITSSMFENVNVAINTTSTNNFIALLQPLTVTPHRG